MNNHKTAGAFTFGAISAGIMHGAERHIVKAVVIAAKRIAIIVLILIYTVHIKHNNAFKCTVKRLKNILKKVYAGFGRKLRIICTQA